MRFSLGSWLKENFDLVATFLGFLMDTIALIALINSPVSLSIPLIDYPLDATAQLIIWIIAAVTYLGFLRRYWQRLRQEYVMESAQTFLSFLACDLFSYFRHPFLLIPFVVLIGFLFVLVPLPLLILSTLLFLFALRLVVKAEKVSEEVQERKEWSEVLHFNSINFDGNKTIQKRRNSEEKEVSTRWKQRIEKELDRNGYVTNSALAHLYSNSRSITTKALKTYHDEFEFEKDLVLISEKSSVNHKQTLTNDIVLACRSLNDEKPWQR
ncbi:MAG: hypothetical protein KME11_19520 [Timaviella obliquedivisa GSE-PSE-MK23-08B]|jgi:ribosomal protein S25|nr:hypothetical protein [Timaviella obliquedivisa GSE-PSE-MK23-08B]